MPIPAKVVKTALASAIMALGFPAARAQSDTPTLELPRVEITGELQTTYASTNSSGATKSDIPLIDTPMAVQIVPKEVIRDRQITSTLEAVRNVSGVQSQPGSYYDQFQIRGFGSGYGVSFRNGLQLEGITSAVNPAFVERIEVIKGPASMLYGRVEPGGFVNVVTKRPSTTAAIDIEQQFSSWGNRQSTVDATGPLSADGGVSYRLIGTMDKGNAFYDFQHDDRKAVYGALAWRISNQLDANLTLEHYDYKTGGRGLNAVAPQVGDRPDGSVPRSRSNSDPTLWANFPDTAKRTLLALDWTYRFNDQWKLTNRFHIVQLDEVSTGLNDRGGVWGFFDNPIERSIYNINLDLSGKFTLAGVEHDLLIGADAYRYKDQWKGFEGATTIPFVSIYEPGYADLTPQLRALVDESRNNVLWKSFEADTGVYLQDRIALSNRWSVLLGGRWDHAWQRYGSVFGTVDAPCYPNCTALPMNSWPADSAFSPRAAVLFKPDAATSLYASYSKSFGTNNSSALASGTSAPPEIGIQYELGAKRNLFNDRMMISATLFQLTKSNVLAEDPTDRSRQIAIGEIRSRGLELDAAGQLTSTLNLLASYTHNPVQITRDTNDPSNEGHRRSGAPLNSASLWLKYAQRSAGTGWDFGAGLQANGQRQGDDANTWQMPGYVVADTMASYRTRLAGHMAQVQFNIKNLFDRIYYDQSSFGSASYGAPRSLAASFRLEL